MLTIIAISGLPGVGKTTLANKINEKLNGKHLEMDKFKRTLVNTEKLKSTIDPPEVRWQYYFKAIQVIGEFISNTGVKFITVDEVFHLRSLRNKFKKECLFLGVNFYWIWLVCDYQTVSNRLTDRKNHVLSIDETLKMHLEFEKIFQKFEKEDGYIMIESALNNIEIQINEKLRFLF